MLDLLLGVLFDRLVQGVGCLELLRVLLGGLVLVFWVVDLLGCFRIWL